MITEATSHSILGRAIKCGAIEIKPVNIRDFAINKHGQVDDAPYGGGAGMVLMAPPVYDAYKHVQGEIAGRRGRRPLHPPVGGGVPDAPCQAGNDGLVPVIYLSPQGKVLTQAKAQELSNHKQIILLCGHYEGLDERIIEEIVTEEISIGDYVLTGGEPAALVLMDAISRLVPGVLGKPESHQDESFSGEVPLLEYPHYTRPAEFMGRKVPEVLLSGHHGNIKKWRQEQSLNRTAAKRPELLQ